MNQSNSADDAESAWLGGACHCGGVIFRVRLSDGWASARRCNCSYCRMRGAVAVSAAVGDVHIVAGHALLSEYRFGTQTARHFFCSRCGIYTHHQRRSNRAQYGINVACIEGMSPFDLPAVPVNNGLLHPNDAGGGVAGVLYYVPNEPGTRD